MPPVSKKARKGAPAASSAGGIVAKSVDFELSFVSAELKKDSQMLMSISCMLRNGTLQMAMDAFNNEGTTASDAVSNDKKKFLALSTQTFRAMRHSNLSTLLQAMSPRLKVEIPRLDADEGWTGVAKDRLYRSMLVFGLRREFKHPLPIEHANWRDLNVLGAMFQSVYDQKGRMLENWSADTPDDVGYFKKSDREGAPNDEYVCTYNNKLFQIFVDDRFLNVGAWSIENNIFIKQAKFKTKGREVLLYDQMIEAHGQDSEIEDFDSEWHLPAFPKLVEEAAPAAVAPPRGRAPPGSGAAAAPAVAAVVAAPAAPPGTGAAAAP